MSIPPHKIRCLKTSACNKSNQLGSLPSCLFLAKSDPSPPYTQLHCVTKPELAIPHSFSSLPMCVIPTISPKQTCLQSRRRMLVTEPNTASHSTAEASPFPRGPLAVLLTSRREIGLCSLLRALLTHASLLKLFCFLFQEGTY